jgi:hypothetical protein
MSDLLVKLYELPPAPHSRALPDRWVLRKPLGPEHRLITEWVAATFSAGWASEAAVALNNRPISLFMAVHGQNLLGFACYDATARGMFGPIGVAAESRGCHLGAHLLLACLHDMRSVGYAYAVVGSAGPADFFARVAGATAIPGSSPGPYRGMLKTAP